MDVRKVIGGAVLLAFVAGAWLGGLFPQLGRGPGTGSGTLPGAATDAPSSSATPRPNDAAPAAESPQLAGSLADASRVLRVRVDGREYLLVELSGSEAHYRPVDLQELVAAALVLPGNDDGIRVRISRAPTAKAATEIALRDALLAAGLSADAIEWQDGPAP